jgi:anti-sigma-K factor RskA
MSPDMSRDEIHELAAGYALGALADAERDRFEALLRAGDPAARRALREAEEVVTGVATQFRESPPMSVKEALMARVAADQAPPAGARVVPLAERPRRRARWAVAWVGAVAAGLAAVIVGLTVSTRYEERLATLAREAAVLREQLQGQQQVVAILRDPATQMVALAGQAPSPEARGRMLWHAAQGGLLVAAGLPAPPAGKAYQLWAIAGQGAPVPAGVFTPDARGVGSLRVPPLPGVARVDVFAITLEPAAGVPAPTGAMYLVGKS